MKHKENLVQILFEDSHVLVLNKPAGLPSQATPEGRPGLEELAKQFLAARDNKPGNVFLHTVHRLDSATSGILLLAKSSKALSRLSEQVRTGALTKLYVAVVEGQCAFSEGDVLVDHLRHGSRKALHDPKTGKRAECRILKTEKRAHNTTKVWIELKTGRYHQIRFQLAHRGHPIVGDSLYGSKMAFTSGAIMLHHYSLTFCHPTLKEKVTVTNEPEWSEQK